MVTFGYIPNFLSPQEIKWFLWYWQILPTKIDTGQRIRSMVHFNESFCHRIKEMLTQKVKFNHESEEITTVNINQDYLPGGIHSDGYIEFDQDDDISLTYLIPLKGDVTQSTVVFNEGSKRAVSLNEENGLGSKGLITYPQATRQNLNLPDTPFDVNVHKDKLNHLKYESLNGLTLAGIQDWELGRALVWPREKLHCSSNFNQTKERMSLLITTRKC